MFYLPAVLIPALLVALVGKFFFPHKITKKEWGLQFLGVLLSTLILMGIVGASSFSLTWDSAIFNGQVTGKDSVHVSCSHQYKCGEVCRTETYTDSKGKSKSRRVCEPKYCDEHAYDVDWDVYTTLGTWTIDRVDRRGLTMPERYEMVKIGDPVAESRGVQNYLLLDRTRFNTSEQISARFKDKLPDYPKPYDYYRITRVVQDSGMDTDYDAINIWLNNQLRKDGPEKQLNVILVVTLNDADYFYALMEYWKGVRKNDVILFYGIDEEENIKWAKAMSFADGQDNQIMLKQLQSMTYERKFTDQLVQEQYQLIKEDFKRLPNKTFEYLKSGWVPPTWLVVTMMIINFGIAIGVAVFVIKEDVA